MWCIVMWCGVRLTAYNDGSPSGYVNFFAGTLRNQTQHPGWKYCKRPVDCQVLNPESWVLNPESPSEYSTATWFPNRLSTFAGQPTNWKVFLPFGLFGFVWSVCWFQRLCGCIGVWVGVGVLTVDFCTLIAKSVPSPGQGHYGSLRWGWESFQSSHWR